MALADVKICGYNVPKGTGLISNLYAASYDVNYWEEPERFNPDRFLTADGKLKRTDAFIPFSIGTICFIYDDVKHLYIYQRYSLNKKKI